jgi:hypothetical protein
MSDPFPLHLERLPAAQRRLWPELGATPDHFVLYGGTAIALQLGHRKSIDFDFFSQRDFDPTRLQPTIPYLADAEIQNQQPNTLTCLLSRGGPVSVSFFGLPHVRRLRPALIAPGNGLRIASLLDLAGTKAHAVQGRAEAKDYIDIDVLITQAGIDLPTILGAAKAVFGHAFNPYATLKALCYFEEPGLRSLPKAARSRLAVAAGSVDVARLPVITADPAPERTAP